MTAKSDEISAVRAVTRGRTAGPCEPWPCFCRSAMSSCTITECSKAILATHLNGSSWIVQHGIEADEFADAVEGLGKLQDTLAELANSPA
jgi:hypothetical protein